MNIQGSNISGSYNSTSKQDTVVKKAEDRNQSQRILSNNTRITTSKESRKKRIDDSFGKSTYTTYSENLKKQSLGYSAAASNASDGANLIQTATDALKETEAILNRMKEISRQATKASLSSHDREVLEQELNSLSSTINEISKNTSYDEKKIFDGDGTNKVYKELPSYDDIEETIIKKEFIEAKFDDKGNSFYKENGADALSKEDALKELQNGGSLYMNGAMSQDEFDYEGWKADNPATEGSAGGVSSTDGTAVDANGNLTHSYIVTPDEDTFTFSLISYRSNNGSQISIESRHLNIKDQDINLNQLVDKLNNYEDLKDKFVFSITDDKKSLVVTSKDTSKYVMTRIKLDNGVHKYNEAYGIYDINGTNSGTGSISTDSSSQAPLPDLYAKGGKDKLSAEEAQEKLASGEKLYTNAFVGQSKAENNKDYDYSPSKTVLHEEKVPVSEKPKPVHPNQAASSYKTLNFSLNAEGSKYASARIDIMDADSLGVTNLNIRNAKAASKSEKQVDEAISMVQKQRDYLSSIGGRLKEAAAVNDKNAVNVKEGQKIDAKNNPVAVEPKEDLYAALEQTVLENANKASEDTIGMIASQVQAEQGSK